MQPLVYLLDGNFYIVDVVNNTIEGTYYIVEYKNSLMMYEVIYVLLKDGAECLGVL